MDIDDESSSSEEGGVLLSPPSFMPNGAGAHVAKPVDASRGIIGNSITTMLKLKREHDCYTPDYLHLGGEPADRSPNTPGKPGSQGWCMGPTVTDVPGAPNGPEVPNTPGPYAQKKPTDLKVKIKRAVPGVPGAPKGPKMENIPKGSKAQKTLTGSKMIQTSVGSDGNTEDLPHTWRERAKVQKEARRKKKLERRQAEREGVTDKEQRQRQKGVNRKNKKRQNLGMTSGANTEPVGTQVAATEIADKMDVVDVLSSLNPDPEAQLQEAELKAITIADTLRPRSEESKRHQREKLGRGKAVSFESKKPPPKKSVTIGKRGRSFKAQKSPEPLTKGQRAVENSQRQEERRNRWRASMQKLEADIAGLKRSNPKPGLEGQIKNKEFKKQQIRIRLDKAEGLLNKNEAHELLWRLGKKGRKQKDEVVDDLTAGLEGL